jgi:hypothetical protein
MSDPKREGDDFAKARRGRNIAIALGLVVFVVIVYVVSIVRMGGSVLERSF